MNIKMFIHGVIVDPSDLTTCVIYFRIFANGGHVSNFEQRLPIDKKSFWLTKVGTFSDEVALYPEK